MADDATPQPVAELDYLRDLVITEMLINDLLPINRRARKHRRKQIEQIARSISEFGFINPILVDDDSRVIAGFGRVLAAQLLGMDRVPTIRISGLSEAQIRAYAIADNRLAELADWDNEVVALEFAYIAKLNIEFDLTTTGFETPEIDIVMGEAALGEPEPPIPPLQENSVVTVPGDRWQLGRHIILCGDARDAQSYSRLFGNLRARAVITDPPYNLRISGLVGKGRVKHPEFAMASGEMREDAFADFLKSVIVPLVEFSVDGSLHYIFMDWRHLGLLSQIASAVYAEQKALIVWDKGRGGMGSLYRSRHELIAVYKSGTAAHVNNIQLGKHGRDRTNVWRYPPARPGGEADLNLHPTSKPVSMTADAIRDCTHRGDVVLDPFGGSGTTLLAAEQTDRRGFLMELNPAYVDLTIRRWQGMTGDVAVHADNGLTFSEMLQARASVPGDGETRDV